MTEKPKIKRRRIQKMKKTLALLISMFMIMSMTLTACAAEETQTDISADSNMEIILQIDNPIMTVNGTEKEIDPGRGTAPVIVNDRTLLPIRAVVEEMGGNVSWNEESGEVTLTYGTDEIRLTIDSTTAYLNDAAETLDVAPQVLNDRTMLPIRFVAESFHFNVDWNETEQKVTVSKNADSAENENAQPVTPGPAESSAERVLVVYFSNTGNTKALAEKIHNVTGGDIAEILPVTPYTSDDLNYNNNNCRANEELNSDARPEIQPIAENIAQYDTILVGYPIWWGQCPPAVRTFLESNDLTGKTIMPFCTSGSSGIGGSLSKIRELCPDSTVTDGFRGTSSTTDAQVQSWLDDDGFKAEL